ncbi:topoisomerase IV [uncultured Methanobrevibacter sp.]|uniref:topoisomerase IV n=1 Tax=uncultured Methanobrevibacter sp. TaxID=253161 RepID=UPI00262BD1F4|nr:topoisomerase IV [uncultured Methanobrevibacter sp.]
MKDSKEKEHRISNLKDMIDNISNEQEPSDNSEEFEEDIELINYLNENHDEYDDLEIDDEFIYHPGDDDENAINLEENIDEDFIIKTPDEKESENDDEAYESDDIFEDITSEMTEGFDNFINAKVGRTPVLAIISAFLGLLLVAIGAFIFSSRSDRVIDNVVSGETNFISVIFFIFGLLLLIYGLYKIIGFRNPLEGITNSIDSIEKDEKDKKTSAKEEPDPKVIPKSNIPLDKESYKIGEFNIKDLKNKLRKPSKPKKPAPPTQEELDKIPPAREKPEDKKGLTADEIEEIEYEQAVREGESIDDIFAEVEDIEDMPIISVDSQDKIEK